MKPAFFAFLALSTTAAASPAATPDLPAALRAVLVAPAGDGPEDQAIAAWQRRVREDGPAAASLERLGWAFVAKARASHDEGFYTLALAAAEALEAVHRETPDSLLLRGHVLHNTHRFAEAEKVAGRLVEARGRPVDQGLLSDALMEQGRYPEAIAACQRFLDGQPGLESFARAAHLRWLTGDLPGAAALMEAAVRAASPRNPEPFAWGLARLSFYQLQLGDPPRALALAEDALRAQPAYPPALLARGRALLALARPGDAVTPLRRAAAATRLPEDQWWLAEALRAAGRAGEAEEVEASLVQRGAGTDRRTLAVFLASRGVDPDRAAALADAELEVRHDPFTLDAAAFARLAADDVDDARRLSALALAAGTADARLRLHAGLIALAAGEPDEAAQYLADAASMAAALMPSERSALEAARAVATRLSHQASS